MEDILKTVIDTKCSVLRDYIQDLESDLKDKTDALARVQVLEDQSQNNPTSLSDAVIKGTHDALYRWPIEALEQEISRAKHEYTMSMAELGILKEPESKYDFDKIKQYPIREFISRFTRINRNGLAICPIHREKTGSLYIYDKTNSWFCFGCQKGGSIIDFMMELNHYSLKEALEDLNKII